MEAAVSQVRRLISKGADIVDIGAQSTWPFAHRISVDEDLMRLIPVLDAVLHIPEVQGKLLSVDTFYAGVASEAVEKRVHIDPSILTAVGSLGVPNIAMHMRGDPSAMQSDHNLQYDDVCRQVASEFYARVNDAESWEFHHGGLSWTLVLVFQRILSRTWNNGYRIHQETAWAKEFSCLTCSNFSWTFKKKIFG